MLLTLKANPGAPKSKIKRFENDILYVDIKAPAQDGKANDEVVRFLAKTFHIPAADIKIVAGNTGRTKKIKIDIDQTDVMRVVHQI